MFAKSIVTGVTEVQLFIIVQPAWHILQSISRLRNAFVVICAECKACSVDRSVINMHTKHKVCVHLVWTSDDHFLTIFPFKPVSKCSKILQARTSTGATELVANLITQARCVTRWTNHNILYCTGQVCVKHALHGLTTTFCTLF